jgi:hypothetical protein
MDGEASIPTGFAMCRSKSVMNLQGFPSNFLLKLKPELEQAEAASLASSTSLRAWDGSDAGFLIVPPRYTGELGVVEIVIRIKLNTQSTGLCAA